MTEHPNKYPSYDAHTKVIDGIQIRDCFGVQILENLTDRSKNSTVSKETKRVIYQGMALKRDFYRVRTSKGTQDFDTHALAYRYALSVCV
jgi:hypothetical protein